MISLMESKVVKLTEAEDRMIITRGREEEKMRSSQSVGLKFQ